MEIRVFPRGFSVADSTVTQADGAAPATELILQDSSGIVLIAVFGPNDWESFQRYVADPVAESARLEARAKLVGPGGMASKLPRKIH